MSGRWRTTADTDFRDPGAVPSSRAMNVSGTPAEVTALCSKHGATISAIEPLISGGTRLVLSNSGDAATMRKALKSKLIAGEVKRTAWVRNH